MSLKSIIGISRGGLIPAVILSHKLNIRHLRAYHIESYDGRNQRPPGGLLTYKGFSEDLNFTSTLLVDDIVDTGKTFQRLRLELPAVRNCCLVTKQPHTAVYAGLYVDPKTWVKFPWENAQ